MANIILNSEINYRFSAISFEILTAFFAEMEKLVLKFIWNCKGSEVAKHLI